MQVNDELCAGCGICADTCLVGAIRLVYGVAEIDQELCTACEACINACPNGAISAVAQPALRLPKAAQPVVESQIVSVPAPSPLEERTTPVSRLAPLAGSVLAFLGHDIVPRVVDVLVNVLERRLTKPVFNPPTDQAALPMQPFRMGRGTKRQARYRGGTLGQRNFRERR
jgi:NAD-dependent dihydropyrimidine dehydrogenase PreA subunit